MVRKRWSVERDCQLIEMYESGLLSISEIANRFGVSPPTIYNHLRRMGKVTTNLPRRYRAAKKFEFAAEERQQILELHSEGKYITDIALKLGKTIGPTRRVFRELGLSTSNSKPMPIGKRFGYLVVVSAAVPEKTYKGHLEGRSVVRCHCGSTKEIFNYNLRSGNTKTCRCKNHLQKRETPYIRVLHGILGGAKYRGFEMALATTQIEKLIALDCFYCGAPPSNRLKGRKRGRATKETVLEWTGIDRIDSTRGYVPGNVLPACLMCNRAKSDCTIAEFSIWLKRLGRDLNESQILEAAMALGEKLEEVIAAPLFHHF